MSKKKKEKFSEEQSDETATATCWCGSGVDGPVGLVEMFLDRHQHENPRQPVGFRAD